MTRCDARGRAERTTTMARILTPTAVAPFVVIEVQTARTRVGRLYGDPDEPGWARAWLRTSSRATRDVLPPAAPIPADLDVRPRITRADDSCRNGTYRTFNRWRTRRYSYRVNTRTMSAARSACAGAGSRWACAWTFTDAGGRIVETDQRYGSRWRWSTRGRPGYYDVESAAAHETGHSIGLGHTTTSRYLTMHHQLCAGCTFARSLGRGDIRGLRALY